VAAIGEIMEQLEVRLKTIDGLRTYPRIPETIVVPAAIVTLDEVTFDSTMSRGSDDLTFIVYLLTSVASDRAGQDKLYAYIDGSGVTSVKQAIEADPDLGDTAMYAVVTGVKDIGKTTVGETPYYSAQFTVEVSVRGLS
jgi:hypothetical protein